jgi:hypothetical protein
MRIRAAGGDYASMNFNYWGTTSTTLIDHMIVDYHDNFTTARVDYAPAPAHGYSTTYPFVEQVLINGTPAETVPKFGTERADFTVIFNRDMDMTVEPFVTFGPSSPHTDFRVLARDENFHQVANGWQDSRTWQGSAWITPMSGDGYHLMRISGAVAADDPWLVSGYDVGRFRFEVRSMEVAAMTLQANGQEGSIHLQWQQDDFDLLAGYNLYRATSATGPWDKLNTTLIPPGSETYIDLAVSPAVPMYYKFSVLSTNFEESDFSNVAMAAAIDTIAPTITHVPVTTAAPARGLRITTTASDNLGISSVRVYYRALGGGGIYTSLAMANLSGDQWTGTIPGSWVTEPGLEYYLVATDGISEAFSGTPVLPHQVAVSNLPTLSSVTPKFGPATGGTSVTLSGMLFEPGISVFFGGVLASSVQVINDNQLTCVTPSHFPALVDVKVINPDNRESTLLNAYRFEETGVVVSLPDSSGDYGGQVEIAVLGSNLAGLRSADLTITWNPAVLSAVNARAGTVTAGWSVAANLNTAGRAVLSMASASPVSGSGSLAIVRFNVLAAPPATSPLAVETVSLNDGALAGASGNGLFTVNGFFNLSGAVRYFQGNGEVPGATLSMAGTSTFTATSGTGGAFAFADIPIGGYVLTAAKQDGAAEITSYDASMILQRAAGLIILNAAQTLAADVNRNGNVTAMDASYVLEHAVGLRDLPFPGAGKIWDFLPGARNYSMLNVDQSGQDFSAILIGDVSGNWTSAAIPTMIASQPNTIPVSLVWDPVNLATAGKAWLLVKADEPAIHGIDLTVTFDPALTLNEVVPGPLGQNHAVVLNATNPGVARIAAASAVPVNGEGVLLELCFDRRPVALNLASIRIDESQFKAVVDQGLAVFDRDQDGLINILETGVYQTDPDLADSDGDGRSDGEEVVAGSSPSNAASFFAVKQLGFDPDGRIRLVWQAVPGRVYQVQGNGTLAPEGWQDILPPVEGDDALLSVFIEPLPQQRRGFYRVQVKFPD